MTGSIPTVRSLQYRDLDVIRGWSLDSLHAGDDAVAAADALASLNHIRRWYGPIKLASLLPNPYHQGLDTFVIENQGVLLGLIQVKPFNQARSTWQVQRVVVNRDAMAKVAASGYLDIGSRLLRHCFERVWEARTWLLEVGVTHQSALALYRFNGFQPLAQATYWSLSAERLAQLAERAPNLPNLLPVSNADASLLYQLSTASVPPMVRQVFDQQIRDFKVPPAQALTTLMDRWIHQREALSGYVFEQQRKAAIGYFSLTVDRDGSQRHRAKLTVHPAYTWLYPELMTQMACLLAPFPAGPLELVSLDYHPEREEFLTQLGATPEAHTLLMSRSVWHKVRESRTLSLEGLQLSDVLSGLQPAGKPLPGRMSWSAEGWGNSMADSCSSTPDAVPPPNGPKSHGEDGEGEPTSPGG